MQIILNKMKKFLYHFYNIKSLLLLGIHKLIFIIFYKLNHKNLKKREISIIFHEGGYGHTIHDSLFFQLNYSPKEINFILFFDYKRHNRFVKNIFKNIFYIHFNIFFLSFKDKEKLSVFVENYLKKKNNNQIIKNFKKAAVDLIDNENNDYLDNVPRNGHYHWTKLFFNKLFAHKEDNLISTNDKIFQSLEEKIIQYYLKNNIQKKKIITIYLKQKLVLNNIFSGLNLEKWKKIIDQLSDRYNIYLFGDYDSIEKYKFKKNVLYSERLNESKEIWSLYAPLNNDYFIGENGAPIYLPVIKKKKILIINSFPWTYAQPNAVVVPKFINLEKNNYKSYLEIFEKYSFFPDNVFPEVLSTEFLTKIIFNYLDGFYNEKKNLIYPKDFNNLNKYSHFNLFDTGIPKQWFELYKQ